MVDTSDIVMIIEIILLISIIFGSYYGRKLNMRLHHSLIYLTVLIQILVFIFWMAPSVTYWRNTASGLSVLLIFHILIGSITLISSVVLCVVFLIRKNEYDLPLLRWTRPLMVFTLFSWILSFVLGAAFYIQVHLLG